MKKLLLLIAIITIGCGSRKSQVSKIEEKKSETTEVKTKEVETAETKTYTNTKVYIKTETNEKTGVVTKTKTIKPVDPKQESEYKGQKFKNAEIHETETTNISDKKTTTNDNTVINKKEAENKRKEAETELKKKEESERLEKLKNTERKFSLLDLLWLLLLIPIFLGCRYLYLQAKKKKELLT